MRIALIALACVLLASVPAAAQETIGVRGSDTMVILNQRWAERFMAAHPEITLQITGGGSGTGISALINGTVDIAASSRDIRERERQLIRERFSREVIEIPVARDGVAMYVHQSNPLPSLTTEQIKAIYTGKITHWHEVGGHDRRIIVYSRENNSGTYIFFRDNVLDGADFTPYAMTLPGTGAVVNAVSHDPNGIGFGGAAYGRRIRELGVAQPGHEPVLPTSENIAEGRYPLSRPLYFYVTREPTGAVRRFIDWVRGPEGQQVINDVGYYPLHLAEDADE
jgi:phosphate transport system substrate-binding protein